LLGGAFGDLHALRADIDTGVVHHREHRLHAAKLAADHLADALVLLAISHDAGRRSVDPDLVLDRHTGHIIRCAGLAVRIKMIFGDDEQRNAARAFGRSRGAGQHQVDDIVGQIMFAEGDVDLLTLDLIFAGMLAFGDRLGGRAQRANIGTGLRLGQVHRAGPGTGDQIGEIFRLLLVGAVDMDRLDRAKAEHRTEGEGKIGRTTGLQDQRGQRIWQALAAKFFRPVD